MVCGCSLADLRRAVCRKKVAVPDYMQHSEYNKNLGLLDLISFGVAISMCTGIYLTIPYSARNLAGPSCIISVILAYIAATIAGCGEFAAFLCAWLTVVESGIALSYVSKEWSAHLNFLFNSSTYLRMGSLESVVIEHNFDYLALIGILGTMLLGFLGLKVVSVITLVLLTVATLVISSSILVGFFYADTANWLSAGYFSNDIQGVCEGAAKILYGFVAIEMITCMIEESANPRRNVPAVVPFVSTFAFLFYFLTSLVITLIIPYNRIPADVPLPRVFGIVSVPASRYVITVGSVCGLSGALLVSGIPAARILYAMAEDGLLCQKFTYLLWKRSIPVFGVLLVNCFAVCLLVIRKALLVDMLTLSLPIRFTLAIIIATALKYSTDITSVSDELAYANLKPKSFRSYSFIGSNGSVYSATSRQQSDDDVDDDDEEDNSSITSSFIARNLMSLACEDNDLLSRGVDGLRRDQSDANLSKNKKSADCLHSNDRDLLKKGCSQHSFTSVNLHAPHNCLRSPCGGATSANRQLVDHIYEREAAELPYHSVYHNSRSDDCRSIVANGTVYRKAWLSLLIYALLCYAIAMFSAHTAHFLRQGAWWAFVVLLLFLSSLFGILVYIMRLPKVGQTVSNQSPVSPYLSLVGIFLMAFITAGAGRDAYWKTILVLFTGAIFYASYSFRNSRQAQLQANSFPNIAELNHGSLADKQLIISNSLTF